MLLVARSADALAEAARECGLRRRQGRAPGPRRHRAGRRRANRRRRHGELRPARRPGQQRRHRQVAPPRRGAGRRLAGGLGAERDGAAARDARGGPAHGRARLGEDRQRQLDRRQAALRADAGVLGRQGRRALAVAPVRRPLRRRRRARQRRLPGADQVRAVDGGGRPARPVEAGRQAIKAATRRSRRPAPSGRSAASPRSGRSPTRSSSCARSAPPTSPAPPGASTAAPCR